MPFEVVYKVPGGSEGYIGRERYIRKSDLERSGEHDLAYFVRTRQFEKIPDFPVPGEQYSLLHSSSIGEPLETQPVLGEQTDDLKLEEIVKVPIPASERPHRFQPVFKMEYGTNVGTHIIGPDDSRNVYPITDYLENHENIIFDSEKIMEIAFRAVEYLRQMGIEMKKIEEQDGTLYAGGTRERVFAIGLGTVDWAYYPHIKLIVAGAGLPPVHLERELGLHELAEQFPLPLRNIAIEHTVCRGVAYNLDIQQFVREAISLAQQIFASEENTLTEAEGEQLIEKYKRIIF